MRATPLVGLVVLAGFAATTVQAQDQPAVGGRCQFEFENRPATRVNSVRQASGEYNSFVSGGVVAHCRSQGITLVADSLEYYGDSRLLYLIGSVHYTEPRLNLNSQRLTYWMNEERLHAEGNVDATLPGGTKLVGPSAEYYRVIPGVRPLTRMVAPGRPTISIVQRDSGGRAGDPMTVIANTVVMEADSLVFASGRVEITRTDITARSDSAVFDNGREWSRLMRNPVIEGKGERPFTLSGAVIDLFARNRLLERVLTAGSAKAVSEDVTITSDSLDMRMADKVLQRAYAWGKTRARAVSSSYDLLADSLDVQMPAQRLSEVHAVRDAFAQSNPDTSKVRTRERDWLRGDTIVAFFDTMPPPSTQGAKREPSIVKLDALGDARSYYQMAARDSAAPGPAVNYVRGRNITIDFVSQAVDQVTVIDQASGVFIEPTPTPAAPTAPPPVPPAGSSTPPAASGDGRSRP